MTINENQVSPTELPPSRSHGTRLSGVICLSYPWYSKMSPTCYHPDQSILSNSMIWRRSGSKVAISSICYMHARMRNEITIIRPCICTKGDDFPYLQPCSEEAEAIFPHIGSTLGMYPVSDRDPEFRKRYFTLYYSNFYSFYYVGKRQSYVYGWIIQSIRVHLPLI